MTKKRWKWKVTNYAKRSAARFIKAKIRRDKIRKCIKPSFNNIRPKIISRSFDRVEPPNDFSFVDNPERILQYLGKNRALLHSGHQVDIDLSGITRLTPDAIALLIANLKDKLRFSRNMLIKGKPPREQRLLNIMISSGFFNFVKGHDVPPIDTTDSLIHKVTKNKVESELISTMCLEAVRHTFGASKPFSPIYEILVECMSNTNKHAGLDEQGKYDWWLFMYKDPDSKVTSFSFLDLGVGIFESIRRRLSEKTLLLLGITSHLDTLDKLLQGDIPSRTKEPRRGQGWPSINELVNNTPNIRNAVLISNNIYAKIKEKEFPEPLVGCPTTTQKKVYRHLKYSSTFRLNRT